MRESVLVTAVIVAVAVAGVSISSATPTDTAASILQPALPVVVTPGGASVPAPAAPLPVRSPLPVPVRVPALPTAPVIHAPALPPDAVSDTESPPLSVIAPTPESTPPTTTTSAPCPIGLVLDPVLGVCIST